MGKNRDYDERWVMDALRRKGAGFQEQQKAKIVYIEPGMLGIKLLGKLDFLVNHCRWHLVIRKKVFTG